MSLSQTLTRQDPKQDLYYDPYLISYTPTHLQPLKPLSLDPGPRQSCPHSQEHNPVRLKRHLILIWTWNGASQAMTSILTLLTSKTSWDNVVRLSLLLRLLSDPPLPHPISSKQLWNVIWRGSTPHRPQKVSTALSRIPHTSRKTLTSRTLRCDSLSHDRNKMLVVSVFQLLQPLNGPHHVLHRLSRTSATWVKGHQVKPLQH